MIMFLDGETIDILRSNPAVTLCPEDWDRIVEMLNDENGYVKKVALEILKGIVQPGGKSYMLDIPSELAQGYSRTQKTISELLHL
ncbi:MAG: hypothetical protein WBA22_01635 [Candidatus Methanofastidiosia archaeon]